MSGLSPEQQAVADRNSAELARHWQQVADHQREIIHQAHALLDSAGVPRVQPNPTNANDLIQRVETLCRYFQQARDQANGVAQVLYEARPTWTYINPVQAASALSVELRLAEQRIDRLRAALQVYADAGAIHAQVVLGDDQ